MIAPFIITLIAMILRFTNLNWDMGGRLHPDEALIVNGALAIRFFSQLFPGFHDYNGFSMYLLRATAELITMVTHHPIWITDPGALTLVGRFLSAAISTASVPLIYVVGALIAGPTAGLIAALLMTFTPLSLQLAHFYTTDTLLVFLHLSLIYTVLLYWRKPALRGILVMAGVTGLALATKNTAYFFLPLPIAAILLSQGVVRNKLIALLMFTMAFMGVFFLCSPYSFLDFPNYLARSLLITKIVNGTFLYEWSAQFQLTTPFFWLTNLVVALGPLAIMGPIGILTVLARPKLRPRSNRNFPLILLSLWSAGFSIFLAYTYLKFIRYDAPLVPVFALLAAITLVSIGRSRPGKIIVGTTLAIHVLWGIMFFHIYLVPNTSLVATNWIAAHIPARATITIETWNSIINFQHPALENHNYNIVVINFYAAEWPDKRVSVADAIEKSDYMIMESPKVKNTMHRVRAEFPETDAFYQDLASGKLGFTQVAKFTSYPRLGPLFVNDESAEETWSVFDHPTITIYQKIPR